MKLSTLKLSTKNLKWNIEITFGYTLASILYYLFQTKKIELDCNYSVVGHFFLNIHHLFLSFFFLLPKKKKIPVLYLIIEENWARCLYHFQCINWSLIPKFKCLHSNFWLSKSRFHSFSYFIFLFLVWTIIGYIYQICF